MTLASLSLTEAGNLKSSLPKPVTPLYNPLHLITFPHSAS